MRLFFNPFLLISLLFMISLAFYMLDWSTIYPALTISNTSPIWFFIFLNICSAYVWDRLALYKISKEKFGKQETKFYDYLTSLSILAVVTELMIYGVPLFGHIAYTDFGAPFLHVFVIASLYISTIYHAISSVWYKCPKAKWFLLLFFVISLLIMNRFLLLFILLSILFSLLTSGKVRASKVLFVLFLSLTVLMGFGELGILRMSMVAEIPYEQARNYILDAGYASEDYKKYDFPVSVYWIWLYITSPLSNLIYNIDLKDTFLVSEIPLMFLEELMPETLSKRIIPVLAIEKNEVDLIVPHLNVTTALANVYSYSWVFGVTIYYLFYTLIYFWASLVLRNLSRVIFTSFISILSMFLIFNNVLKMPLFAFSVLLIVLISFISKEKLIYAEKELH